MASALSRFNAFLSGIDLDSLREKYRPIKLVELDMPRNVQALSCIYEQYWDKRHEWPDYEDFYEIYLDSLHSVLEAWRKECRFSEETFYLGLPARIYRTWASLLTQIQGGYVAEDIYGKGSVEMNAELDYAQKDMVIKLPDGVDIFIQVKKISWRKDAVRREVSDRKEIEIFYSVPSTDKFKQDGEIRKPFKDWEAEWGDRLEWLDNGFVIFKHKMFERSALGISG
ncbi:MAG: TaqI family restriction endonuclease [Gammaproteobacteria bacterium]